MPNPQGSTVLLALDLAGTFAFGLSGGLVGVRTRLDLFGIIVLAAMVGLVGGMTRDIILGSLPPATFSDWRYLVVAAAAGLVAFFARPTLERFSRPVNIFDAAGLSLFCVTGATKALAFDVGAVQAVLRDALVRDIPIVLRSELYAIPALVGATIIVVATKLGHQSPAIAVTAAAVCFL